MILRVVPMAGIYPVCPRPVRRDRSARIGAALRVSEPEEPPSDPDKLIRRAYSIASSSLSREYMEFYVALVTSGALTPRLFGLNIGDRIWLGPKITGMFTFDQVPPDAERRDDRHRHRPGALHEHADHASDVRRPAAFAVLHGARHSWDLGYRSELMTLQHLCPNFTYLADYQPPERRTAHLGQSYRLRAGPVEARRRRAGLGLHPTPENTHVFLCGARR